MLATPGLAALVAEAYIRSAPPRGALLRFAEDLVQFAVVLAALCIVPLAVVWLRLLVSRVAMAAALLVVGAPTVYYGWYVWAMILFYMGVGYSG